MDRRWKWRDLGEINGYYNQLDPHGNLYTICNFTRMVRRIDLGTHKIRSIANASGILS